MDYQLYSCFREKMILYLSKQLKLNKVLFLILFFLSNVSVQAGTFMSFVPMKSQHKIGKIVVYKSFWKGGTTAMISAMFKDPLAHSVDTTNINIGTNLFLNEFESILLKSKQVKHRQQKISGISVAGEFWYNQSDKHFFIICLPDLLIDISTRKEYRITDESLLKQMYDWIDCSVSVK